MNEMKRVALGLALLWTVVASLGSPNAHADLFSVGRSAQLHWVSNDPGDLQLTPVPLSRMGGTWFEGFLNTKPVSIWVSRRGTRLPPTPKMVEKNWKKSLLPVTRGLASDATVVDQGCTRLGNSYFSCLLSYASGNKFVASKLLWKNRETFLIQASSRQSGLHARKALDALAVRFK
ncbi:MAG: hypothetical protein AAB425_14590 [Bdellovibrionota bacterium]